MKKLFAVLFVLLSMLTLASCGNKGDKKDVFIIEYVTIGALDDAKDGIIEALADAGFKDGENIKITVLNPQAKSDTLAQMAEQAVGEADIIFCIATPVALAVKAEAEKQGSDVPILFTAVTDAVASGIVSSNKQPGGNISGTSDLNPVADQVALIDELGLDISEFGFLYTTGEPNSEIQLAAAKEAGKSFGLSVRDFSVTTMSTDLDNTLSAIVAAGLKVVYIPTDNEVSSNMAHISEVLGQNGIITVCGEEGEINAGGTLTIGSVNYLGLGKLTGEMGAKVLNGTNVGTLDVGFWTSTELVVNTTEINKHALPVPAEIISKANKTI